MKVLLIVVAIISNGPDGGSNIQVSQVPFSSMALCERAAPLIAKNGVMNPALVRGYNGPYTVSGVCVLSEDDPPKTEEKKPRK